MSKYFISIIIEFLLIEEGIVCLFDIYKIFFFFGDVNGGVKVMVLWEFDFFLLVDK